MAELSEAPQHVASPCPPGRKRKFDWAVQLTKHWLNSERAYGHNISKSQLFRRYERQLKAREQTLRSLSAPEPHKVQELEEITHRLSNMESKKQRTKCATRLRTWCDAECVRPQLTRHMSMLEESIRAKLTWQSFDSALHRCAFGTIEELSNQVARPAEFRAHIGQCILGFSDQVPLWVKETQARSVYASWETRTQSQKHLRAAAAEKCAGLFTSPAKNFSSLSEPVCDLHSPATVGSSSHEDIR